MLKLNNFIYKIVKEDIKKNKCNIVRTRFSPEPNGYLHIGHVKSIFLNFELALEHDGKCNLRFDDTNPSTEKLEFVKSIINDVKWLGFKISNNISYASNYFNKFYRCALILIMKGLAYVDELTPLEIKKYRGSFDRAGKDSPYRNRSAKENLFLFKKMKKGIFREGEVCLRAKISMKSPSLLMRDPILYRIKYQKHYNTGDTWCIYPTYDFAHCISDAIEKITHSLCTLEFQENKKLYNWILNNLSIFKNKPEQYEFSRLNIEYSVISKRIMSKLIEQKIVDGWNDPRLMTVSGLRRRGYTPTSIRNFCSRIGITRQNSYVQISVLESCIRDELNIKASRMMAVLDPLKVIIENLPNNYQQRIKVRNHPTRLDMGFRHVYVNKELWIDKSDFKDNANKEYRRLTLNQKVKMKYAFIIAINKIIEDKFGNKILICNADLEFFNKKLTKKNEIGIIHWVSAVNCIPAEFRIYDRLFNTCYPSGLNDLNDVSPNSLVIKHGFVESGFFTNMKKETHWQFEREGYFCLDNVDSTNKSLVFNKIVSLKSGYR